MPKEENLTGEEVVALTKEYLTEEDVHFVHKALIYAVECHSGQYRKSGEPYIIHPIQVAGILAQSANTGRGELPDALPAEAGTARQ